MLVLIVTPTVGFQLPTRCDFSINIAEARRATGSAQLLHKEGFWGWPAGVTYRIVQVSSRWSAAPWFTDRHSI